MLNTSFIARYARRYISKAMKEAACRFFQAIKDGALTVNILGAYVADSDR